MKLMKKLAFYITVGICAIAVVVFFTFDSSGFYPSAPEHEYYEIEKKWEMPNILEEVSGIVVMDSNRIACVQDEQGIIFIFNLKKDKIEEEIKFGGNGDYEGLAINGDDAYVLRSDGTIFEVSDFMTEHKGVRKFETELTARQNLEGLCLDAENNRLLLAIKSQEEDDKEHKGVYTFDLVNMRLDPEPFFSIDLKDPIFEDVSVNQLTKKMRPAEIAIHPQTGEIYMIDGRQPKILILDKKGNPKELYLLDKRKFNQPEGMNFSKSGQLFISNEGHGNPANILQVNLQPKPKKEKSTPSKKDSLN